MFFLICFLGIASASPPDLDVSYETGAIAPNDAAAVLFVEDYVHLQDVDGARRDAELMRRTFTEVVGIAEKQVRLTTAGNRSRMKSAVVSAAKKVKEGGTLWVYFSGYGLVRNGEWLLLGKDTKRDGSTAERDGLNLQELYKWSDRSKIARVVIILDAAFNGTHRDGSRVVSPPPPAPPRFQAPQDERIAVWMADWRGRTAPHYRAADHGMFTYLVAGALRGWADGARSGQSNGVLTLGEIQRFVRLHTHALGSSHASNESESVDQKAWELLSGKLQAGPGGATWASLAKVEQNLQVIQAVGRYRMQAQAAYEMAVSSDDPEQRTEALEAFVRHFGRPEVVVRSSMWLPEVEAALRELDGDVPEEQPETEDAVVDSEEPVASPTPTPSTTEAPRPPVASPQPAPAAAAQVATPEPPKPQPPAPVVDELPPPPGMPTTCKNLLALEPFALMGQLTDQLRSCLEERLAAEEQQTLKNKMSRVLMMDAEARRDSERLGVLLGRHLKEIDRSDPDLCFKYSLTLARKGIDYAEETIRWADYALENKQEWTRATYKRRLFDLYKLRAETSNKLWNHWESQYVEDRTDASQGQSESWRNQTKQYAREWLDYAKASSQRVKRARNLCIASAGTSDFCESDSEE